LLVVDGIRKLYRLNFPGVPGKHVEPVRLKGLRQRSGLKPRSELKGRVQNPKPNVLPSGSGFNKQ
jgi:hypothetical protein